MTSNSPTFTLSGVVLGSHWDDNCGGGNCFPPGPTLISLAPGCGGQSASEFPGEIAKFGIWCTPATGVTLQPGQSIDGAVTLRPGAGGPPDYTVYSGYNDPVTGKFHGNTPTITNRNVVAPAATDIQISGSASNGSPVAGSTFTYGPNGQATVVLTVTAATVPQQIANTASALVVAPQTDSNARNNNVTVSVTTR